MSSHDNQDDTGANGLFRNEQEIISVHSAGVEDVDNAVHAARVAFHGPWRKFSPAARGRLLLCLAGLVEAHKEVLATIETWDNGI